MGDAYVTIDKNELKLSFYHAVGVTIQHFSRCLPPKDPRWFYEHPYDIYNCWIKIYAHLRLLKNVMNGFFGLLDQIMYYESSLFRRQILARHYVVSSFQSLQRDGKYIIQVDTLPGHKSLPARLILNHDALYLWRLIIVDVVWPGYPIPKKIQVTPEICTETGNKNVKNRNHVDEYNVILYSTFYKSDVRVECQCIDFTWNKPQHKCYYYSFGDNLIYGIFVETKSVWLITAKRNKYVHS